MLLDQILPPDSHFKLYLFVWNETRATGRVVAFPARSPCECHMMCPLSGGRSAVGKGRTENAFTGRSKSLSLTVDLTR